MNVSPVLFSNDKPRIFVNWLSASKDEGCFNLRCPGFVQVSNKVTLGGVLPRVSVYGGDQFAFTFTTYKDTIQGKWWMVLEGEPVDYRPLALTEGFEGAPRINWGGSVCNTEHSGFHTVTQMGNGHFPMEGYKRASHIRNIMVMDSNKYFVAPSKIHYSASYEGCYRVAGGSTFPGDKGPCIYYGGPGGKCCNARCRK